MGKGDRSARANVSNKNEVTRMIEINKETYYTVKEFADSMKVHRQTVRLWIRDKKLAAVKIMHRVLISEGALVEFMNREMKQR
jgi:excisionase family DNA binding protein